MNIKQRLRVIQNWSAIEQLSYWLVGLLMVFLPIMFWDFTNEEEHRRIVGGWIRILPFLLIFLIHNIYLLPQLLLRRKYWAYFTVLLIVIFGVNYVFVVSQSVHEFLRQLFGIGDMLSHDGPRGPRGDMPHPRHGIPPHPREGMGMRGHFRRVQSPALNYTYNILVSFLLVGFNITLKLASRWLKQEQERKEEEKGTLEAKLTALQNQVSPHFFMNTLNNIHALIDYDKEDAKNAVLQLSKMMRYMLYESNTRKTQLDKEIQFLRSYIDLMKLRLQPTVELKISLPEIVPDCEVYSLLGISIIENAFKYGVRARGDSYIYILMEVLEGRLHINCRNTKAVHADDKSAAGGIGLENTRKRLELLFKNDYTLNIYNREDEFEVDLNYPIL